MPRDPIVAHVERLHRDDSDVTGALFGPVVAGDRVREDGLVSQVAALREAQSDRMRLSRTDRAALLSILLVAAADVVGRVL